MEIAGLTETEEKQREGSLRIGLFCDSYTPHMDGVSISLHLVADGLRHAGHQVTVFVPRFPGYQDDEPGIFRAPALPYPCNPPYYIAVPGAPRYTWTLSRMHLDVLHANTPLTIGMLAYLIAATRKLPLIYTYHTYIAEYTHHVKFVGDTRAIRRAARWFSTASTNLGDQVVVPSPKFKRLLLEQKVRKPIHVIPNGIDLDHFNRSKKPGSLHTRLGLKPETPLLLSVGRLDPEKRLEFLIKAVACLPTLDPAPHLVFVGDGSARRDLEARAASTPVHDRIHFLGMIPHTDIPDLLHDATVFLSASTTETQCLAMVEAIAAGLPVMAVKDEAFEGIVVDGENGSQAALDIQSYSAALSSLLSDPANLTRYGRRSVELSQKFSIQGQVQALENLYSVAITQNQRAQDMAVFGS